MEAHVLMRTINLSVRGGTPKMQVVRLGGSEDTGVEIG